MRAASALIARGLRAASGDGSAAGSDATPGSSEAMPAVPAPRGNATSGVVERSELRFAAARKWQQAEDRYLLEPDCAWQPVSAAGAAAAPPVPFGLFAVFDGHGGKAAAEACVAHMLPELLAALARAPPPAPGACGSVALNAALPAALVAAFLAVDATACAQPGRGGATATVAAVVGRTVTIASAGDSLAVLDAGAAVARVSAEHRLEGHGAERDRVIAAGATVAPSTVDGDRPAGPLRVWPGGLAVSRSIGDADGKPAVTASPEVSQFALPRGTGARLMLASDGLWDAAAPKAVAHAARAHPGAAAAASALLRVAAQKRGHRDDVTTVVVDFLPSLEAKGPFGDVPIGAQAVPGAVPVSIKWPITGVAAAPAAGYVPPDEAPRQPKPPKKAAPAAVAAAAEEEARWAAELAAVVIAAEEAAETEAASNAAAEEADDWVAVPTKRKAAAHAPATPPKPAARPVVAAVVEAAAQTGPPAAATAAAASARKALKMPPRPRGAAGDAPAAEGEPVAASDVAAREAVATARAAEREAKKAARREVEREARRAAAAARAAAKGAAGGNAAGDGTSAEAAPVAASPAVAAASAAAAQALTKPPPPAVRRTKEAPKPRQEASNGAPLAAAAAAPPAARSAALPPQPRPAPQPPVLAALAAPRPHLLPGHHALPPQNHPQSYYAPQLQFGSFAPAPHPVPAAPPALQFGSFGAPQQAAAYAPPGWAPYGAQAGPPAPRVHRLEDVEAAMLRSGAAHS